MKSNRSICRGCKKYRVTRYRVEGKDGYCYKCLMKSLNLPARHGVVKKRCRFNRGNMPKHFSKR